MMRRVNIFSKSYCGYCKKAIQLIQDYNITPMVTELDSVENGEQIHNNLKKNTKQKTVPLIFIDDVFIGGYDVLLGFHNQNKLYEMLYVLSPNDNIC